MPVRGARVTLAGVMVTALATAACAGRPLVKQYEYEEEIYLGIDGSATVVVNASLPALAALRGLPVPTEASARVDRGAIRRLYEADGVEVTRVSRPWRRRGRRFVQVRVDVDDIRRLGRAAPFAWSTYTLETSGGVIVYRQRVAAPAGDPKATTWIGDELVAFRLHVPSRIQYHNAPSKEVQRGNILVWEQPLAARLGGAPLDLEVRMEPESILRRTLIIFAAAGAAAIALLVAIVWWVVRRGRAARAGA